MDNENLKKVLEDTENRQFWIKQWGDPDRSEDYELQSTTDLEIPIDFSKQPISIQIGDILIIHRIKLAKIMFVGEVLSEVHKSTAEELKKEPWREKWQWRLYTKNLTPNFGNQWREHFLKSFALASEYNQTNPQDKAKLGRLNFGAHVRVPENFGKFIISKIMNLEEI